MEQRVNDCEGDQIKNVFSNTLHSLLGSKKIRVLPEYTSSHTSASTINISIDKINIIKIEVSLLEACLPVYSFDDIDIIMSACTAVFDTFHSLSCDVLSSKLNKTTCVLDLFPTKLLISHLSSILDIMLCIVNPCFSSVFFQHFVSPLYFFL